MTIVLEAVQPPIELDDAWRARFWRRVDKSGDCWMWTGATIRGYRQVHVCQLPGRKTVTWYAHRISWHLAGKPLHAGLTIDHLCRTPLCVNPSHMEEVTQAENNRRAFAGRTHCFRGHEFTTENTVNRKSGGRACRECVNASQRSRRIPRGKS